jgi:hypothetical protein
MGLSAVTNDLVQRWPWEVEPAPEPTTEEVVKLLQRDFAIAVQLTAVMVHSTREEFKMIVNTRRGQIIPRGECRFTDGTVVELQDIGMCQPGLQTMTVPEIMAEVIRIATDLGMEILT